MGAAEQTERLVLRESFSEGFQGSGALYAGIPEIRCLQLLGGSINLIWSGTDRTQI